MVKLQNMHIVWTEDLGIIIYGYVPKGTKPEDIDLSDQTPIMQVDPNKLHVGGPLELAKVLLSNVGVLQAFLV